MYKAPKKSVEAVKQRAKQMSIDCPDILYYVMDKKRKHAVCHSVEWAVKEKVLNGWHIVCLYRNGIEYNKVKEI